MHPTLALTTYREVRSTFGLSSLWFEEQRGKFLGSLQVMVMLVSPKPFRPSRLSPQSTPCGFIVVYPRRSLPSPSRHYWRDPRSPWGSQHAGKVYKGFHTRDADVRSKRRIVQASLDSCDRYVRIHPSRLVSKWRPISSWKQSRDTGNAKKGPSEDEDGDWFSRWELRKRKQFDAFKKQIEDDPYQALFGASNRWLKWTDDATYTSYGGTPKPSNRPKAPSTEANESGTPASRSSIKTTISSSNTKSEPSNHINSTEAISDYEIDPITLRKVPKSTVDNRQPPAARSPPTPEDIVIPVKKFEPSATRHDPNRTMWSSSTRAAEPASQISTAWLSQEGFGQSLVDPSPAFDERHVVPSRTVDDHKLESSLDRHIKGSPSKTEATADRDVSSRIALLKSKSRSESRVMANKTSNNFRAQASGVSAAEKVARTKALEKRFDEMPTELDRKFEGEVAGTDVKQVSEERPIEQISSKQLKIENVPRQEVGLKKMLKWDSVPCAQSSAVSNLNSSQVSKMRAKLVPLKSKIHVLQEDYASLRQRLLQEKRRIEEVDKRKSVRKARQLLDIEIQNQKDAMQAIETRRLAESDVPPPMPNESQSDLRGEGDVATNVHEFAGRARWYKRKAPHAQCEMDTRLQRLAKEKMLVREIRGIYEETYGTIDTTHRQMLQPMASKTVETQSSNVARSPKLAITERQHKASEEVTQPSILDTLQVHVNSRVLDSHVGRELKGYANSLDACLVELQRKEVTPEVTRSIQDSVTGLIHKGRLLQHLLHSSSCIPLSPSDRQSRPQSPMYRILAYDSSAQKVTSARVESQAPLTVDGSMDETPLSTLEALNRLHNPGKFLLHVTNFQSKGYDIVSVSSDLMVLKKMRDPVLPSEEHSGRPNPIDGTTSPEVSTGNFASPTGYVNYGPVIPPEEQEQRQPQTHRTSGKVRRQEDVFSGTSPPQWPENRRSSKKEKRQARRWQSFRHTIKGMLIGGSVTAAACYAVGMVLEMNHI